MNTEKILRSVPTTEKIFRSARRVNTFKAADCVTLLSKMKYDAADIKKEIQELLSTYKIIKVKINESNPNSVDLQAGKTLNINDVYIWAEEETSHWNILVAALIMALVLLFVMFQLWPVWLKQVASYSKYPLGGFIMFLLVMGVMRLAVFGITYFTHPPGLWILPNLYAECGFFESFIPLYSWANQDSSHNKTK